MTAVNIATSIIDKLQAENRNILETLHKCQDQIKYLERQLADKNRIIKILEDRHRVENDGVLEMTKRQNELTIKHLEMQIQKLLKENENLEIRLEALKAEICPKCETKLLMAESRENIGPSKFTKQPGKSFSALHEKKSSQTVCPNRVKALERIVEHKDKRIMHLSKEVKRLSTLEEENTKKIQRLNKLLSLSRLPKDSITENLLREIQQLESQLQLRDCSSEPYISDVLKLSKPSTSYAYSNKTYPAKSTERLKTSAFIKPKPSSSDLPDIQFTDTLDVNKLENQVLQKRLQQICHSVDELMRLITFESENLSHCLNSTANEYHSLKTKLKEIVNNLNEIVQNILSGDLEHKDDDLEYKSDDKHIISCLQNRLKESLNMVSEYENKNKALKESLEKLKTKMTQQSFPDSLKRSEKLQSENQILQNKLDVSEKNIKACENVIETLQEKNKRLEEENEKLESELHEYKSKAVSQAVAERNSARFASFTEIETLKKNNQELEEKIKILEENNKKLQEDINAEKSKNVLSEALSQEKVLLQSKSEAAEKQISTLEKSLEILQERLKTTISEKNKFETQLKEMIQSQNVAEAYENDVMALKNELILKEDEIEQLKERLNTLERKAAEINYYRKNLHEEVEGLYKTLMENEECEDSECRKAIYKAAILHWAQGLLQLDDNYNLKTGDSDRSSALEEMTRQTQVYLTEVSRIHELITLKEQAREEELREYLSLNDGASLKQSSRSYETHVKGPPVNDNLQSSSTINNFKSPDIPESETVPKVACDESTRYKAVVAEYELKKLQEELEATNSVTRYLLSSCSRLEDALDKEKANSVTLTKELEDAQETIKDLKVQLNSKSHMTKRLNNLIDLMRSKEYNDEMTLDHLKNEIQWLADKATATDSELCQCKEENNKMKNELNSLKRELMNEKYEKAKTNNQLKQLRMQILNSQITLDETPIT